MSFMSPAQYFQAVTDYGSVESSDISLCVLSVADVLSRPSSSGTAFTLPSAVSNLLGPETFVLINKTDLLPSPEPVSLPGVSSQRTWMVSLTTGEGTQAFMKGFGRSLQEQ